MRALVKHNVVTRRQCNYFSNANVCRPQVVDRLKPAETPSRSFFRMSKGKCVAASCVGRNVRQTAGEKAVTLSRRYLGGAGD